MIDCLPYTADCEIIEKLNEKHNLICLVYVLARKRVKSDRN